MIRILLLANLTKDNQEDLDKALEDTGLKYSYNLDDQSVVIFGDNDDLYKARVAILAKGFIIK